MTHHGRRAFSIMNVIVALPLIAVAGTLSFQLVQRMMRVQTIVLRRLDDEAMATRLVQRLQRDTRRANTVALVPGARGSRLELISTDGSVVYEVAGNRVTRSANIGGTESDVNAWIFEWALVELRVERIESTPRIVWFTVRTLPKEDRGAIRKWKLSAAAAIGREGRS